MPSHRTAGNVLWQSLAFIIVCAFFLAAVRANLDLTDGRFALFMDERITFDGVRRVLHPKDFDSLLWAIADGGDQRYGRILWNATALASFLPEMLWGAAGQIIASRMLETFVLLAAFLVFAFGLVRSWPLRLALLASLLAMPYTDYYMTMPKPEPLQLLFLAIFSVCHLRRNSRFGSHWLFLGLAFGAKISALPAILVFGAASFLAACRDRGYLEAFEQSLAAMLYLLAGFTIAVPIFLESFVLAATGYVLLVIARTGFRLGVVTQVSMVTLGLVYIFMEHQEAFEVWVSQTVLNTAHGADRASVNAWSWAYYFFQDWLAAPAGVGAAAFGLAAAFVAINTADLWRRDAEASSQKALGLALVAAGAAWNLAIFLAAHRLWGLYLFPGSALALAGLLTLADASINQPGGRIRAIAGYGVAVGAISLAAAYWAPKAFANLDALAGRTRSNEYRTQRASYAAIVDFLERHPAPGGRRLQVAYDPALFNPSTNSRYRIWEFSGPYTRWNESPDVIVFGTKHTAAGEPVPADSPQYQDYLAEREGYAKFVVGEADPCPKPRCFRRELTLPSGGELLVLDK